MKISDTIWNDFSQLVKKQCIAKFDPTTLVSVPEKLSAQLELPHKGFYIGIETSSGTNLGRFGFLQDKCDNILASAQKVIEALYIELSSKNITVQDLHTGKFYFTVVWDVIFNNNGLAWDEDSDGVYLSWGDRYKAMYLPYEIKKMAVTKVEVMNRLCAWEAKIPSNFWKLPEGLCSRILCDSYSI